MKKLLLLVLLVISGLNCSRIKYYNSAEISDKIAREKGELQEPTGEYVFIELKTILNANDRLFVRFAKTDSTNSEFLEYRRNRADYRLLDYVEIKCRFVSLAENSLNVLYDSKELELPWDDILVINRLDTIKTSLLTGALKGAVISSGISFFFINSLGIPIDTRYVVAFSTPIGALLNIDTGGPNIKNGLNIYKKPDYKF